MNIPLNYWMDDGQSPKTQQFCVLYTIVRTLQNRHDYSQIKFCRNLVCVLQYNDTCRDEFLKLHTINLLYKVISVVIFSNSLLWSDKLLLGLASTVILGSASRGIHDQILLSHNNGSRAISLYWSGEYTLSWNAIYSSVTL
jgi:hypothetical protein